MLCSEQFVWTGSVRRVEAEPPQLAVELAARQTERAGRAALVEAGGGERLPDRRPLELGERGGRSGRRGRLALRVGARRGRGRDRGAEPEVLPGDEPSVAEDRGAFQDVPQLSDVSRPAIADERLARVARDPRGRAPELDPDLLEEGPCERQYVLGPLAERRDPDLEDGEPVEEVLAKRAALDRGAEVTVVAGATTVEAPSGVKVVKGISAREMFDGVMAELPSATVFVGAAAVADYAPANAANAKIKKEDKDTLTLELKKTPDILSEVSKRRKDGQLVVGFAAETNDVITYAKIKMGKKGLDLVVANDITKSGAGFNTDTNIATLITKNGQVELPLMSKREMADKILDEILKLRKA